LGCAEYTLLILISLAVIVAQFPSTIRDTFPSCEQSSRLSGTLSPQSRAADGKLELLTDGGQRVALYRPETLGALPAANRWQIWVTPYHPDSLQESTLYPVRIMADEQQCWVVSSTTTLLPVCWISNSCSSIWCWPPCWLACFHSGGSLPECNPPRQVDDYPGQTLSLTLGTNPLVIPVQTGSQCF